MHGERGVVYFACTSGGAAKRGQIFRYRPSLYEGQSREADAPGLLELFVESRGPDEFEMADNIVAAPFGHLMVCEDGPGDNFLRGVTPSGQVYAFGRNADPMGSELCGVCFSPEGSTLFVNVQNPGYTLAITGPWSRLALLR